MKFGLFVVTTALLGGCASSSQTYTADGGVGHSLNCSGLARNWGMCQEKAGEICGARGYNILSTSGDKGLIATGSSGGDFFAGTTISRSMVVQCK